MVWLCGVLLLWCDELIGAEDGTAAQLQLTA